MTRFFACLVALVALAAACTETDPDPDGSTNPYAGDWSNMSFTTTAGTFHLHSFVVGSDGAFGAGPDDSVRGYTAVGMISASGTLTGELSWRTSSSGGVTTKPFSGSCPTTSSCMATITEGRVVLTR
jgi:hypothetical protein